MSWSIAAIPLTFLIVICCVILGWLRARENKLKLQTRAELQQRLIDRFSTASELVSFLQTPEGSQYMEAFTAVPFDSPRTKVIGSVRTGLIIVFASVGLIAAGAVDGDVFATLPIGLLGAFVGAGFLVSAIVTWQMAKSFGLVDPSPSKE